LYKTSADVDRQLVVLSVHVLSAFNAHVSEINVKESSNTDWMSMKLKEETAVVLLIKLTFIWTVKNQSVRD